ncbi:MAG TPA: DUF3638 domain-containing protein, partial [Waddliaceae bacterium]
HSVEFPDYYLLTNRHKTSSAIGEDALLFAKITKRSERFALIPTGSVDKYVSLTWNERGRCFRGSPFANLFFISHLLGHRYIAQAKEMLECVQPFTYYGRDAYELFKEIIALNYSLEAQLIGVQVALHFLENRQEFFATIRPSDEQTQWSEEELCKTISQSLEKLEKHEWPKVHPLGLYTYQKNALHALGFSSNQLPSAPETGRCTGVTSRGEDNAIGPLLECQWYRAPLLLLGEFFYKPVPLDRSDTPFPLSAEYIDPDNKLAQLLYNKLTQAHVANCQHERVWYQFNGTLHELKEQINGHMRADTKKLDRHKEKVEQLANAGLPTPSIWLHDQVYRSLLSRSHELLIQMNPSLSPQSIQIIWQEAVAFMLVQSRIDQAKEALELIDKLASSPIDEQEWLHQKIAKVLFKERLYDPTQYIQFLLYEYAMAIFLRPEQSELLFWIFEQEKAGKQQQLIEFQAGGGKTKVITPLLSYLAVQNGLMPIFFSLPSTYPVVRHDFQSSLQTAFHMKTHVLEIGLETELSEEELTHIYSKLKAWHAEGAAMVITPIVYHKLHLILYENAEKQSDVSRDIIAFLQTQTLFIIDEAHRNLVSTWQANVALSETPALNQQEQQLFIIIYKLLVGVEPYKVLGTKHDLRDYVGLDHDRQSSLTATKRKKVATTLATWLCRHHFKIEGAHQPEVIAYLSNPKAMTSLDWLRSYDKKQIDLFFLCRGLLTKVLKVTLQMMHL